MCFWKLTASARRCPSRQSPRHLRLANHWSTPIPPGGTSTLTTIIVILQFLGLAGSVALCGTFPFSRSTPAPFRIGSSPGPSPGCDWCWPVTGAPTSPWSDISRSFELIPASFTTRLSGPRANVQLYSVARPQGFRTLAPRFADTSPCCALVTAELLLPNSSSVGHSATASFDDGGDAALQHVRGISAQSSRKV